jgi:hypothetical protein
VSDIVDMTQEREERLTDTLRRFAHAAAPQGPVATGFCLWCGEELDPPRRWCNAECRDDWQWWDQHAH